MKWVLIPAAGLALGLGCATPRAAGPEGDDRVAAEEEIVLAEVASEPVSRPEPTSRTHRLGFWVLDLLALDREPRGTSFRLLDFRIFRLLKVGGGPDYHEVSLIESPVLFHLFATRGERGSGEFRLLDIEALSFALVRSTNESEQQGELHVFKLPFLGSLYGSEREGGTERVSIAHLIRYEVEP